MIVKDVEFEVKRIAAMASDPELAHLGEDELWRRVLMAIAAGEKHPRELASAALRTAELDFSRWYA